MTNLEQELKQQKKTFFQTLALGAGALVLIPFGQFCLQSGSPLLEKAHQAYPTWQLAYFAVVLLLAIVWCMSCLRQISSINEGKRRQTLYLQNEAAKLERIRKNAELRAEREAAAEAARMPKKTRSTKFDY